jgi:glucuronoarabinoxylan endo-1,4-beta-xylanase
LEGFGASHVWSGSTLVSLGDKNPEIYDVLFADLGLDIVRLRNNYGYGDEFDYDYIANCEHAITNGRDRTGRPLKIMISSWSPPASLKSTDNINGNNNATLKQSGGNYVYSEFGTWWADSVEQYASQGMVADYISIQNEPDFSPSDYEGCRFNPAESSSIAGYGKAFDAVYNALYSRMGSSMPKMLAPETTGFQGASGGSLSSYLSALNLSHVYGYAHHLYNCSDGGNAGCGGNPDNYIGNMTSFGNSYGDKPILQTEYSNADQVTSHDACINLAVLMHNSLVEEGAAGYLYWQLAWGEGGGLVSITTDNWTINPVYYAMLHYSKFTDPGWRRVEASTGSSSLRISAYISPDKSGLSVVIINTASQYNICQIHLKAESIDVLLININLKCRAGQVYL